MKANSPLDIYPYLPDVCEKVYGEKKMAVAAHLVSRVYSFEDFSEKITALMKDDPSSGKTEEERCLLVAYFLIPPFTPPPIEKMFWS